MNRSFFVYILECSDLTYYVGVTNNLERRLNEHQSGYYVKSYTFKRRPVTLVYYEQFSRPMEAITYEKRLKGWSHKKKQALIEGDMLKLKELAVCRNITHYQNKQRHASTPLGVPLSTITE